VNVLFTVGLIVVLALWAAAVLRRLTRMQDEVKLIWKKLELDQSNDAIKNVYNKHVNAYNNALDAFPTSIVAMLAGFKQAKNF
jgi:hypothetical protein